MKHLKSYKDLEVYNESFFKKLFKSKKNIESDEEIKNNIIDMCLELSDEGFDIKIHKSDPQYKRDEDICLQMFFDKNTLSDPNIMSLFKESLLRVKEYLGSKYSRFLYLRHRTHRYDSIDLNDNTKFYDDIVAIMIFFKSVDKNKR
jgi:hypothetical protein